MKEEVKNMVEKIYYINNGIELEEAIDFLQDSLPCFVEREPVEMDYSKITINARVEDLKTIEKKLAPLV
jgi:hypothetical protein